jgi:hypothetical protein
MLVDMCREWNEKPNLSDSNQKLLFKQYQSTFNRKEGLGKYDKVPSNDGLLNNASFKIGICTSYSIGSQSVEHRNHTYVHFDEK